MTREKLLQGIVVPTVTPLTPEGRLDEPALRKLIGLLLQAGGSGIFAVGTTGEGPALSLEQRKRTVDVTCEAVQGRIPVIVAALETSAEEALLTSAHAARAGADAVAVAPPFYFALSEADVVRFGQTIADRSALPAYLYNVPYAQLPQFSVAALEDLGRHPRVLGLKDSSGDFEQLRRAIAVFADRPECSVLVGPERLLQVALQAGADGGVCGGGNLFPSLYASLFRAHRMGDATKLQELQQRVLEVERHFYHVGEAESSLVRGLKSGLEAQGVCGAVMAQPFAAPSREEIAEVAHKLAQWKDVVIGATPGMV